MIHQTLEYLFYAVIIAAGLFALYAILRASYKKILSLSEEAKYKLLRGIMLTLGIFILLSLVTYNPADYTGFKILQDIQNKGGLMGAAVSRIIMWTFGFTGYFIPALLIIWGLAPYDKKDKLVEISLRTFFGTILLSTILSNFDKNYGGIVGEKLLYFFTKFMGNIGRWIILTALFIPVIPLKIPKKKRKIKEKRKRKVIIEKREEKEEEKEEKEKLPEVKVEKEVSVKEAEEDYDLQSLQKEFLKILHEPVSYQVDKDEIIRKIKALENRLEEFRIKGKVVNVRYGPVITCYEYEPAPGIKINQIVNLADELGLSLKSGSVRIAPIEGKSVVGIEVPNKKRYTVYLKKILVSPKFTNSKSKLTFAIGDDTSGESFCFDLAECPHLLIAGATGSGKSVCLNALVASILYRAKPDEVQFLMIDPKRLELTIYNGIPHLVMPVINEPKEALNALKEALCWMEARYKEFAKFAVRDIEDYNKKAEKKKPYIVIVIDELADLMLTAPREIEEILTRLAQMSRAVGIHIVIATQRPSVDIITGLIKANFPARIAFLVASRSDSRTILDMIGAEKLLGKGDMLFLPPGKGTPVRLHGAYISTEEAKTLAGIWARAYLERLTGDRKLAQKIVEEDLIDALIYKGRIPGGIERIESFCKRYAEENGIDKDELMEKLMHIEYYKTPEITVKIGEKKEELSEELDPLFEEAKKLVIRHQTASVSLLQRHFKIGYARAGRLIDQLEKAGIVGPYVGSKAREVLVPREALKEEGENVDTK